MPGPARLSRRAGALVVLLAGFAGAACVGQRPSLATDTESTATTEASTTTTAAPAPEKVAQANTDPITLFATATAGDPSGELTAADATAAPDIPVVFLVKGQANGRVEVYLPTPPLGSTAWVRKEDVALSTVAYRIEVSLRRHQLTVFEGADEVLSEKVQVGEDDRPEPGRYYLKELLQPPDPDGAYGTYAYGLSGYDTELTSFVTGNGFVGIHGAATDAGFGKDVAEGSIGLPDGAIARLVDEIGLPLGTPVDIER